MGVEGGVGGGGGWGQQGELFDYKDEESSLLNHTTQNMYGMRFGFHYQIVYCPLSYFQESSDLINRYID